MWSMLRPEWCDWLTPRHSYWHFREVFDSSKVFQSGWKWRKPKYLSGMYISPLRMAATEKSDQNFSLHENRPFARNTDVLWNYVIFCMSATINLQCKFRVLLYFLASGKSQTIKIKLWAIFNEFVLLHSFYFTNVNCPFLQLRVCISTSVHRLTLASTFLYSYAH